MEIIKSKAVKLRSHLDKYLVADDDRVTVRQSRNGDTRRSVWLVEASSGAVRFRNYATGLYLTASDAAFLLGVTGKKVVQSAAFDGKGSADWTPERDGFQMRLKTTAKGEGKFLRANGGTPPWRNTVTYDVPVIGATSNWTLWDLEAVEVPAAAMEDLPAPTTPRLSTIKSGMEFFTNAKLVLLRSHHGKYLTADKDEDSVSQNRSASSKNAHWSVELTGNFLRLKSFHGKYLTASDRPFLLGMTGCKVIQTLAMRCLDSSSSVEWEPVVEGERVKLRARNGNFLRANGGLPPWRNSITHDFPHRAATRDWVLWDVHVMEFLNPADSDHKKLAPPTKQYSAVQSCQVAHCDSFSSDTSLSSLSDRALEGSGQESSDSIIVSSPPRLGGNGRVIYYQIADKDGNVNDENGQGFPFIFNGNSVEELTRKLEKYTGIQDIIVCTRSPLDGKLCPLRLHLPPNALSMHLVVVPSTSLVTNLEIMGYLDGKWNQD